MTGTVLEKKRMSNNECRIFKLSAYGLINPMLLQRRVERLSKPGLLKADHFGALDPKKFLQILRHIILDHRVMPEIPQDLLQAIWGNIARNQNKLQMALAAKQIVAPHDQKAGPQYKPKQKFRRLNDFLFFHEHIVALAYAGM